MPGVRSQPITRGPKVRADLQNLSIEEDLQDVLNKLNASLVSAQNNITSDLRAALEQAYVEGLRDGFSQGVAHAGGS